MWKIWQLARIQPVIAGDTTYCVSLLTGTMDGSNFAIPRQGNFTSREWSGVSNVVKGGGKF